MFTSEISWGNDKKIIVSATDTFKICAFHVKMTLSIVYYICSSLESIIYGRIEYDSSITYS